MTARPPQVHVDPDVGIPDLIRRLTDDSKRLVTDEVQLAKLEMHESLRTGSRGVLLLAVAFGVGVVAMVAGTLFLISLVGRLAAGHMWVGALTVGVLEVALAMWLLKRGGRTLASRPYTFPETRESLKDTTTWVARQRAD